MLMSWMPPPNEIDSESDQRRFLEKARSGGNYWISGFAGSGKTVLIVEKLKREKSDNPDLDVCVVLYTHSLIDLVRTGIPDDLGQIPVKTFYQFRKSSHHYDLILVDEVQDLPEKDLRRIKSQSDQLIVAGDDDQSIYDERVDPEEISSIIGGEQVSLTVSHRLPPNIMEIARQVFEERNLDSAKKSQMTAVQPRVGEAETRRDEVEYVWTRARQFGEPGSPAVILIPSHSEIVSFTNSILEYEGASPWSVTEDQWDNNNYQSMNRHLQEAGLKLRYLGNSYGRLREADSEGRVFIMTYHSVKGLDFETVFIPRLSDRLSIWRGEERARTLFYVAFTRSRRDLYLTYTGRPHRFIRDLPEENIHRVSIPEPEDDEEEVEEDPFGDITI